MTTNGGSPLAKGETLTKGETAMIDKQTAKFVARIAENLPANLDDDVMQGWIDNPRGLQKFLRDLCPPSEFSVWKTITLGTGLKSARDFRRALKDAGCKIDSSANDILGRPAFTVSPEETEVDLVMVTCIELGFKNSAIRADICKRAQKLGLQLVPAEVGPQLRLQYLNQPPGECLNIGMEPITCPRHTYDDLCAFSVNRGRDANRGGELWLDGEGGDPGTLYNCDDQDDRWIFVRRK